MGISKRLGGLDYLPIAVNAVWVLSADIVLPAKACTAFECTGPFNSSHNETQYSML